MEKSDIWQGKIEEILTVSVYIVIRVPSALFQIFSIWNNMTACIWVKFMIPSPLSSEYGKVVTSLHMTLWPGFHVPLFQSNREPQCLLSHLKSTGILTLQNETNLKFVSIKVFEIKESEKDKKCLTVLLRTAFEYFLALFKNSYRKSTLAFSFSPWGENLLEFMKLNISYVYEKVIFCFNLWRKSHWKRQGEQIVLFIFLLSFTSFSFIGDGILYILLFL